jgi:hypothetical protein
MKVLLVVALLLAAAVAQQGALMEASSGAGEFYFTCAVPGAYCLRVTVSSKLHFPQIFYKSSFSFLSSL